MQCPNPEIIAGQLVSIRNIYLRQEIHTISQQIQEHYKDRLPALRLVSLAAYEQVFNRQPLSSPEELRREAVRYGRKYYELNLEKLQLAEARNDRRRSHNPAGDAEPDENQSDLSDSRRSRSTRDRASFSHAPDATSTREQSTLSIPPLTNTSPSKEKSKGSMRSTKSDRASSSKTRSKRTGSPKIIVHRASEKSLASNKSRKPVTDTKNRKRSKAHRSSSSKKRHRRQPNNQSRSRRRR